MPTSTKHPAELSQQAPHRLKSCGIDNDGMQKIHLESLQIETSADITIDSRRVSNVVDTCTTFRFGQKTREKKVDIEACH